MLARCAGEGLRLVRHQGGDLGEELCPIGAPGSVGRAFGLIYAPGTGLFPAGFGRGSAMNGCMVDRGVLGPIHSLRTGPSGP